MLDQIRNCQEKVRIKIDKQEHLQTGQGNSAKAYCLNIVNELLALNSQTSETTILDLGCGRAQYMRNILSKYPKVTYVGVEPNKTAAREAAKNLSRFRASIIEDTAYFNKKLSADIILSFSVLEHVYKRREYFRCIKQNLADKGVALINYDAGHFTSPSSINERILNLSSPILAKFGKSDKYQRFVKESEFEAIASGNGLSIIESLSFNTQLKDIFKLLEAESRDDFSTEWLRFELKMNAMGLKYRDDLSKFLRTRNHIVVHDFAKLDG